MGESAEFLPENMVIAGTLRRLAEAPPASQDQQRELLAKVLPNNHRIRKAAVQSSEGSGGKNVAGRQNEREDEAEKEKKEEEEKEEKKKEEKKKEEAKEKAVERTQAIRNS